MNVKTIKAKAFCFMLFSFVVINVSAQDTIKKTTVIVENEEEEEGPIMYKFEPDFLDAVAERKAKIQHTRKILDTLDISERKRRRLLKDLYKNGITDRLSKVLVTTSEFEDEDIEQ